MDEHDWTSTYPATTQHLPSMDTPLNFYFRCDTHNVCLDTLASLSHHTFSCTTQQRVKCRWTCGHCALTFATSLAMRRHLTVYSVRMGYAKSANFATPQMVNLPYFRRKSHIFPPTALQVMANDALRACIVPRYNAMHNHSSTNILRLSSEAANIRKSGHPLPQIVYSPISPAQAEDTNSSELSSSDTILTPTLPEEISSHMGIDNPSPLPSADTTSTICTTIQTCDSLCQELSHLQDIRKRLSHTLNVQCALLQKLAPTPLSPIEQQMLQSLLSQNILPMSFANLFSSTSTEIANSISAFNLGANHFLK